MPTNDFLPFATAGGANVTAQATYAAAGYVSTGRSDGILPSDVYNKIARQSSIAAYLLGQLVVDVLAVDALDNGTVATVLANLKLAIAKTPAQPTIQRFTSGSGTYTPTSANVRRVRVRMVGPGAGAGGATANNGSTPASSTTFENWTAIRGSGGVGNGGAGGVGGTGGVNGTGILIARVDGANGNAGSTSGVGGVNIASGAGGSTVFGGNGAGVTATASTTGLTAKTNSGSGGSGGSQLSGASGGGGGAGEYVEFWMTYAQANGVSYSVGPSGAGGAAGTSAGGAGAVAIIICEEWYV